jgi:hypothetical protein
MVRCGEFIDWWSGEYEECDCSPTFPMVAKERLYQFLETCLRDEVEAEIEFRAWVRKQVNPTS